MTIAAVLLIGFCVVTEIARELCFKLAADRSSAAEAYGAAIVGSPIVWAGVGFWLVEMLAWVMVLQTVPLTLAFPMMALVYAGVPAAAALFLQERMSRSQIAGAALIALGVVCVSASDLHP
jgi:undecaprenyl phosphate-alpha-L-ara4N flippase subunit ArnE